MIPIPCEQLILVAPLEGVTNQDYFQGDGTRLVECTLDALAGAVKTSCDAGFVPIVLFDSESIQDEFNTTADTSRITYKSYSRDIEPDSVDWLLRHPTIDVLRSLAQKHFTAPSEEYHLALTAWVEKDQTARDIHDRIANGTVEADLLKVVYQEFVPAALARPVDHEGAFIDQINSSAWDAETRFTLIWKLDRSKQFELAFNHNTGQVRLSRDMTEPFPMRSVEFDHRELVKFENNETNILLYPRDQADAIRQLADAAGLPLQYSRWGDEASPFWSVIKTALGSDGQGLNQAQSALYQKIVLNEQVQSTTRTDRKGIETDTPAMRLTNGEYGDNGSGGIGPVALLGKIMLGELNVLFDWRGDTPDISLTSIQVRVDGAEPSEWQCEWEPDNTALYTGEPDPKLLAAPTELKVRADWDNEELIMTLLFTTPFSDSHAAGIPTIEPTDNRKPDSRTMTVSESSYLRSLRNREPANDPGVPVQFAARNTRDVSTAAPLEESFNFEWIQDGIPMALKERNDVIVVWCEDGGELERAGRIRWFNREFEFEPDVVDGAKTVIGLDTSRAFVLLHRAVVSEKEEWEVLPCLLP